VSKSKVAITAGAVLLSAALAVVFVQANLKLIKKPLFKKLQTQSHRLIPSWF
jgi:hypothetical protein